MFLSRKKIPCYVLVYDQLEIIKKSLNFLSRLSDRLDIIVIENPSENTTEIKQFIVDLGRLGRVKRYYLFDDNITNNAYDIVLTKEEGLINKSPFILITDGDLTADSDDWLDVQLEVMQKNNDIFACGVGLSLDNLPLKTFPDARSWIPEPIQRNNLYDEANTGVHLLMVRGWEFIEFNKWRLANNMHFIDDRLHYYCYEVINKRWARTNSPLFRHLTWDLYADNNNSYTRKKTGDLNQVWRHSKTSPYTLINF